MSEDPLKALSDMASDAHARIQAAHQHINPVVEVRRGMRDAGIPADVMTIDCLRTRRRITLILHDGQPGMMLYQFVTMDVEVGNDFKQMPLSDVAVDTLFDWMQDYFG
ncbi:hypothetical protein MARLIPOL_02755 [Marinobacter lipolyticus SM19]|uniref:Uncharacterized protein n=1 Tax=Marinobacter lipolyticus SM19 TaxID=1318628 RepID=R8B4R4_9GAMM|nr:hypothetical protein [Marinobacter lipolyticus]EON93590.1 hypothetical protein MARLIPOL_02755 [Marinobacter lipolyticus SM19]